jgi:hypothetical protein
LIGHRFWLWWRAPPSNIGCHYGILLGFNLRIAWILSGFLAFVWLQRRNVAEPLIAK